MHVYISVYVLGPEGKHNLGPFEVQKEIIWGAICIMTRPYRNPQIDE